MTTCRGFTGRRLTASEMDRSRPEREIAAAQRRLRKKHVSLSETEGLLAAIRDWSEEQRRMEEEQCTA